MTYFDPLNACESEFSTLEFCDNSEMWKYLTAIAGTSDGKPTVKFVKKYGEQFKEFDHHFNTSAESSILPDLQTRMYGMFRVLFSQFVDQNVNKYIKFTGITFNNYEDTLYLSGTILSDEIAHSREWGLGKHVLFKANFTPTGIIQDSTVVAKFDKELESLITHNGVLFALVDKGVNVLELSKTGTVLKTV